MKMKFESQVDREIIFTLLNTILNGISMDCASQPGHHEHSLMKEWAQ